VTASLSEFVATVKREEENIREILSYFETIQAFVF
jgi:hypothetical protein